MPPDDHTEPTPSIPGDELTWQTQAEKLQQQLNDLNQQLAQNQTPETLAALETRLMSIQDQMQVLTETNPQTVAQQASQAAQLTALETRLSTAETNLTKALEKLEASPPPTSNEPAPSDDHPRTRTPLTWV